MSLRKEVPMEKRKRTATEFLNIELKLKKYRLQRKSSQRGVVIYKSEMLAFEHQSPVNKNGNPPDSINTGTVL